jgi:hypothetical protein
MSTPRRKLGLRDLLIKSVGLSNSSLPANSSLTRVTRFVCLSFMIESQISRIQGRTKSTFEGSSYAGILSVRTTACTHHAPSSCVSAASMVIAIVYEHAPAENCRRFGGPHCKGNEGDVLGVECRNNFITRRGREGCSSLKFQVNACQVGP